MVHSVTGGRKYRLSLFDGKLHSPYCEIREREREWIHQVPKLARTITGRISGKKQDQG